MLTARGWWLLAWPGAMAAVGSGGGGGLTTPLQPVHQGGVTPPEPRFQRE